ncbi:MAG TPA: ribonuclease domain-containing protein [Burkholderiales bacterium]|nr:ribonuclease domain-containing protein [Burkholderiales bacterium]
MIRLLAAVVAFVVASNAAGFSPLDEIRVGALPPDASRTIRLIHRGGPFPFAKDGSVFANREQRLPWRYRGYYREYTVAPVGARQRGARRIVSGRGGELYYTRDHYRSFLRIRE